MITLSEYSIKSRSIEEAAASDILCTLTPSRDPIVKKEWISAGTHINAIGADAEGKEELEPSILKEAVVVVDDISQASAGGEINVPIKEGVFTANQIHGTLAELVVGDKKGRTDDTIITVFDSTGIAIEDLAVAKLIVEKAQQTGGYPTIDLVET